MISPPLSNPGYRATFRDMRQQRRALETIVPNRIAPPFPPGSTLPAARRPLLSNPLLL